MKRWLETRRQAYVQKVRGRGHIQHLAVSVIWFVGIFIAVRLSHMAIFKLGWMASPGATTWPDLLFDALLPGVICGEIDWSDIRRRLSQGKEESPLSSA